MTTRVWALSVDDRQALIKAAFEGILISPCSEFFFICIPAKEHSYSPYSKFPVGAALMAADGSIIKGANIENASYGASAILSPSLSGLIHITGGTICAERTAIVKAVVRNHLLFRIYSLAQCSTE